MSTSRACSDCYLHNELFHAASCLSNAAHSSHSAQGSGTVSCTGASPSGVAVSKPNFALL